MMKNKQVSIKDVAQLANVSTATVSRFLHGEMSHMSKSTGQRVNDAIEKLNYVPNAAARTLITSQSKTIAIVVVDISDSFSTELFKGACSILEHAGYVTVMLDTNSDQNKEKQLINEVGINTYDGLILQPLGSNVQTIQSEVRRSMPIVTLDRPLNYSPWPQVLSNNYEASLTAARYFKKSSYEQAIVLSSPISVASTRQERLKGIREIYPDVKIIEIDEKAYDHHSIVQQLHQLLDKSTKKTVIFSLKERWLLEFLPSLIANNDLTKYKTQISGFADTNLVSAIWSDSKMITQDPFQMGKMSGNILLKLLNDQSDFQPITVVPTKF